MSYVLGIDIGTSFTAAAVAHLGDEDSRAPQTLNLGLHTTAVPSVIFMDDDGHVVVGEAAERRAMGSPDRVVREFKRRVGDTVPIVAGDLCVAAEDIFAVMARWVADRAEEREGGPPEAVTISHPAGWGEYKTGLIRQALAGVGLADVTLLSEPEAAALHYASQQRVDDGSTVAVYDLGGGTFDAALLRKTSSEAFEPLGRPAGIEQLGGADFDEAVFAHVAENMGGVFGQLDTSDPAVLLALSRVRRECREAKEALSSDSEATIPVLLPGTHSQVRLVRSEFEAMIDAPVRHTVDTLAGALDTAGLEATDLSVILLIGGSSRISLVAQLLSEQLERPIAVDADPKASICLGAAYAAAARLKPVAAVEPVGTAGGGAEWEADTAAFAPARPAPGKARHSHQGVRIATMAAGALLLTGLTAAAAQGPAGLLAPLTSFSAQDDGGTRAEAGEHTKKEQNHQSSSDDGASTHSGTAAVSGANSRADAAATARADQAAAAGGESPGGSAGEASGTRAGDGTAAGDGAAGSSPVSSPATKSGGTGTTASPSNTGSPASNTAGPGPTTGAAPGAGTGAGTTTQAPGTRNPAPGTGTSTGTANPNPGNAGTAAPGAGTGTGAPTNPGTDGGTPAPVPGSGTATPAPGTSAPAPPPPEPAPTETLPAPGLSTQPVAPASGAPSSTTPTP